MVHKSTCISSAHALVLSFVSHSVSQSVIGRRSRSAVVCLVCQLSVSIETSHPSAAYLQLDACIVARVSTLYTSGESLRGDGGGYCVLAVVKSRFLHHFRAINFSILPASFGK